MYVETTSTITSPDSNAGGTASATLTIVNAATITLGPVPATENRGTAATFTGTFTVDAGSPPPTAQLGFYNGGTLLGSAPLYGSGTTYTASFTTTMLPAGSLSIVARYPDDGVYSPASSSAQNTFVIANNLWIGNGNSSVSAYSSTGVPYLTTAEGYGGNGVAIDSDGNVWSAEATSNSVAKFSNTGTILSSGYTGGGISSPTGVAIDGSGRVWVTNSTNSISVLGSNGTPVSSTPYTGGGLSAPQSPAIDESGNLWIANPGGNSVTEVIGVASPTLPLALGVANNTTGTKP